MSSQCANQNKEQQNARYKTERQITIIILINDLVLGGDLIKHKNMHFCK